LKYICSFVFNWPHVNLESYLELSIFNMRD
jgi:hypothetical protein